MTLQTVRLDHFSCRIGKPGVWGLSWGLPYAAMPFPTKSNSKEVQKNLLCWRGNFLNPGGGNIVEPTAKGFAPMDGTNRWSPWTSPATCSSAGERPIASRFRLEVFFSLVTEYINDYIPMWDGQIPLQQSFPIISSWEMF